MTTPEASAPAERDWENLKGGEWALLLVDHPEFADRCDWEKLDGYDWAYLLSTHPE